MSSVIAWPLTVSYSVVPCFGNGRPDGRTAAAEDEVVGAETGELELRLLDREQVLDRLRQRTEPVLRRDAQLVQLVLRLRQGDPAVQVDLQRLGADVGSRDVRVDAR